MKLKKISLLQCNATEPFRVRTHCKINLNKILFGLLTFIATAVNGQQWSGPNDINGTIYRNGFVGIGTSIPQGYLHINPTRPIIIKNNGGSGVYGSEIGFNAILNTLIVPNQFKKLGGTGQTGGASLVVDYNGNMLFQMYDAGLESESTILYSPQIAFTNIGNVGIGTIAPSSKLHVAQVSNTNWAGYISNAGGSGKGLRIQSASGDATPVLQVEDNYGNNRFLVQSNGNVGIGTANPDYKLTINGKIKAEEIQVVVDVPADYVFDPEYNLTPLEDLEKYVSEYKHLPGVPNAEQIRADGWRVGEMNNKLLEKIEEITLYLIEMRKENNAIKIENTDLKNRLELLEKRIE